jgi:excisionase family DNA binding protein
MDRFTLDQAAETLGISKDAVRKRVKRGTLPHTKDPDGKVHVFLDSPIKAKETQRSRLWNLADAAAVVAIFAADERTRTAHLLITSDKSCVAGVCTALQIPHI